jgi:predicted ATPase/Tfp pilus assembly protein PilF
LVVNRQTIQLVLNNLTVDAVQFEQLLFSVEQHTHRHLHLCQDCLQRLAQAIALYQGELLAGFSLPDEATFEEWLFFRRERLHQKAISVLNQLTTAYLQRGDIEKALLYASHLVSLDRFQEQAHRQIIRMLNQSGQHSKALEQYENLRRLLRDELGVEPAVETTALYRQTQAMQRGEAIPEATRPPAARHNFPIQFTPFIGRELELRQIEDRFLDPECRLLSIIGPGGMGKTRLIIRASEDLAKKGDFADGIYFFSLVAVHNRDLLLTALASGLGVPPAQKGTLQKRLFDYLQKRKCLLVLDNFEHLTDCAPLLAEMLAAAPGLRLLVTSLVPLRIRAEQRLTVSGLSYPEANEATADLHTYSAVRLFVESARQVNATFQLNTENEDAVRQICRLARGIPLAVEMAAAWVRVMDCTAIAGEIGRNLDFLSLSDQDRPGRHQSMVAVFTYSWNMLTPTEQLVLSQLAVFHGPFSLEAAVTISKATPITLARLLDKSHLQHRKVGRYELHEMLRQFIGQETGGLNEQAAQQHCDYYLNLVVAREGDFYGPQPQQAVAAVQHELDNIRQAWRWAVEHGSWPAIECSLEGLGRFYQIAALLQEGKTMIALAVDRLPREECADTIRAVGPRLFGWYAYFLHKLGRHSEAITQARQAFVLAGQDEAALAEVHSLFGLLLPAQGEFDQAVIYLEKAIAYYRATAELERLTLALQRMVLACWRGGKHDETLRYSQQAVPLLEAVDHKKGLAQLYNVLAGTHYDLDNLAQALVYVQQAQEIYEAIDEKLDAAIVAANLASLHQRMGQFEQALVANQRAIDMSRELGDRPGLARDLSNRGYILCTIGEFERSLDFYYRALEIEKTLGNKSRIAYFQAGIALIYQLQGDAVTALEYYNLALPVLLAQASPFHIVGPLLNKAELFCQSGEWAAADALYEQVHALATETGLPEYLHKSRVLAAKLAFGKGAQEMARQQLAALLTETEDEGEQATLHYELWQMTKDTASHEAALTACQRAYDHMPSFVNQKRLQELQRV